MFIDLYIYSTTCCSIQVNLGRASMFSVQISDCFNSVNILSSHFTVNSVCDNLNISPEKHDLIVHIDRLYSILLEMQSMVIVTDKLPGSDLLKSYSETVRDVILSVGECVIADRRSQVECTLDSMLVCFT